MRNLGCKICILTLALLVTTVGAQTSLNLLLPDGGQSLPSGDTYLISWETDGSIDNIKIEYSTNQGVTWNEIVASTGAMAGSYLWQVPQVSSDHCLVLISAVGNPEINDTSTACFTIFPCTQLNGFDLNGDCLVNLFDIALLAGYWLACGNPFDYNCTGNHPPVIISTPVISAILPTVYSYDVDANDLDPGTELVFSLDVAPTGMTINSQTGLIQWANGTIGETDVVVMVRDDLGATDQQPFVLTLDGELPTIVIQEPIDIEDMSPDPGFQVNISCETTYVEQGQVIYLNNDFSNLADQQVPYVADPAVPTVTVFYNVTLEQFKF